MAPDSDDHVAIARRYERFAMAEARGVSPIYEQLALAVADSSELLTFLSSVPSDRRQPNLLPRSDTLEACRAMETRWKR